MNYITMITDYLSQLNIVTQAFLIVSTIDVLTGVLGALSKGSWDSKIGTKGGYKLLYKLIIMLSIDGLQTVDLPYLTEYAPTLLIVSSYFVIVGIGSIIENGSNVGVSYPTSVINRFNRLEEKYSAEDIIDKVPTEFIDSFHNSKNTNRKN